LSRAVCVGTEICRPNDLSSGEIRVFIIS
jgi:hypothetical protein